MRRVILPALLLLAGCGLFGGRPPIPPEEDTPQHRACREEARNAESVRKLDAQRNPSNEFNTERLNRETRLAEIRAYRDCLRRNGLAMPGGVEPIRPR